MNPPTTITCPVCGADVKAGGVCAACALGDAFGDAAEMSAGSLGHIGGHELLEVIARGGMGIVYRARQSDPPREVALKALPGAELMSVEARQRFKVEGQAMAKLDHPVIVPVYEVGEEDGTPFFTMKLATGGTLSARIGDYAGKWREIAELISRIAEAVQFAHRHGVLHRDLKPGNILFDEGGQALVSDFGLAKIVGTDSDLTRTIAMMGTPSYMAPEMAHKNGGVTTACDVWSLGVMLYELLAGHVPFQGENIPAVLRAVAEDEPAALTAFVGRLVETPAPIVGRLCETAGQASGTDALQQKRLTETPYKATIPRDLGVITFKALQKTPARRYASAQELADDLRRWLRGDAITARSQPVAERCWRWLRRHPVWAAAALLLVGGIVLLVWNEHRLSQRNAELSLGLSDALVQQVGGRLHSEDLFTRHEEWMTQLQQAAVLAPSLRVRSMTAAVLAMPRVMQVERHRYRNLKGRGEAIAVSGDLKLRLTYRQVAYGGKERLIELTALDAALDDAPALWRRHFPEHSPIDADMSDDASRVVFTKGNVSELWDTRADQQIGQIEPLSTTTSKRWLVDLHATQPLLAWIDPQGALWAWRFPEGEKIRLGAPAQPVQGLVWSPAGDQIATSHADGVQLWRSAAPAAPGVIGWAGASGALAWSAQGLVVGHTQRPEAAVIREQQIACVLRTGDARLTRFDAFPGTWQALAVSADNKGWLWDMRDGRPLVRFSAGQTMLKAGTDGRHFVGSRENTMMSVYEITHDPVFREFECPRVFPDGAISSILRVSADGRTAITVTKTGLILWDRKQGRMVAEWPLAGGSKPSVAFSPDGRTIFASQKGGLGLYRRSIDWKGDVLQLGEPELVPGTAGQGVWQIDRSGTRYLLADAAGQALWEGTTQGPDKEVSRLAAGQRERRLSAAFTFGYTETMAYRVMPLYAGLSGRVLQQISIDDGWAGRALFSLDERWMMAYSRSYYRLHSVADWQERFEIKYSVSGKSYGTLAFSPDARLAVLEQSSDLFALVTIPEGRRLVDLHALTAGDIISVAMPDSQHLLLLNRQHRLYEWDLDALQAELGKMGTSW